MAPSAAAPVKVFLILFHVMSVGVTQTRTNYSNYANIYSQIKKTYLGHGALILY